MGAVIVRISRVRHRKFGDSVSQSTWAAYSPHLHQGGREALSTPPHPPPRPCPFCLVLERSGEGTRSHHIAGTRQSVPAFTECARAVPVTAALPTKQVAGFLLFSLSLRGRHNRGSGYAASATVGPSPPTRESWVKLGCGGCVRVSCSCLRRRKGVAPHRGGAPRRAGPRVRSGARDAPAPWSTSAALTRGRTLLPPSAFLSLQRELKEN